MTTAELNRMDGLIAEIKETAPDLQQLVSENATQIDNSAFLKLVGPGLSKLLKRWRSCLKICH